MSSFFSLKYKYIVVGYGYDYYRYVYRQLEELPYTYFVNNWPVSKVADHIYSYHFNYDLPFKQLWVKLYVGFLQKLVRKMGLSQSDHICFLLLAGGANNRLLSYGLCEKIKEVFINSKIVFFINDLVNKTKQPIQLIKKYADLVYSYDPEDCKKYGLQNHVIPYSNFKYSYVQNPNYDIAFVGAAKDRLSEILSIYFYLSNRGVKCHFKIIGVPKEQQVFAEGISYSGRIPYEENLKFLQDCNCVLDVIQGESSGNTIRVGEAIIMGKKLLTNNVYTPYNGVFDSNNMRVFKDVEGIDIPFLLDRSSINYDIKEKMHPIDLLRDIDSRIC